MEISDLSQNNELLSLETEIQWNYRYIYVPLRPLEMCSAYNNSEILLRTFTATACSASI